MLTLSGGRFKIPFDFSTDALIEKVKVRGTIPTSQALFTEARFLDFADDQLQNVILPLIMSIKGDYFVTNFDQVMTSSPNYAIPSDAVGLKIKNVLWLDSDGRPNQLVQINEQDVENTLNAWTTYFGFYIQENHIVLVPQSREGTTLRIQYYKSASKMVTVSSAGQIVSINTGLNQVTLTNVPTTWAAGTELSAIDSEPGFLTKVTGLVVQSLSSPIVTLDDVTELAVGDWICLDGDSPIPQVTKEAHPILAQAIVMKCLEALGDTQGKENAKADLATISQIFIDMMAPRADGQAKKIVNRNGVRLWSSARPWGWR